MNNEIRVLDYLAAHAPADPANWFEPNLIDFQRPIEPPLDPPQQVSEELAGELREWRRDPLCYDITEAEHGQAATVWALLWTEYFNALREWDKLKRKQRLVQWPYAWAAAVIEVAHYHTAEEIQPALYTALRDIVSLVEFDLYVMGDHEIDMRDAGHEENCALCAAHAALAAAERCNHVPATS